MDIISNKKYNTCTLQFYFVVVEIHSLKDSDSNIIMIILHENRSVEWSGRCIICLLLNKIVQREDISIIIKVIVLLNGT